MICDDALRQPTPTTIYLYNSIYVYTMWCSMRISHRRCRFTEFFFRFYRIRGILMSVATAGWGGPYASQHPPCSNPYDRRYTILFYLYTVYTHTHTTSNNSIVLNYNDGLKYVFVIFIFFPSSVRYTRRKSRPEY